MRITNEPGTGEITGTHAVMRVSSAASSTTAHSGAPTRASDPAMVIEISQAAQGKQAAHDAARIQSLREAVEKGTLPIDPSIIARRLVEGA